MAHQSRRLATAPGRTGYSRQAGISVGNLPTDLSPLGTGAGQVARRAGQVAQVARSTQEPQSAEQIAGPIRRTFCRGSKSVSQYVHRVADGGVDEWDAFGGFHGAKVELVDLLRGHLFEVD